MDIAPWFSLPLANDRFSEQLAHALRNAFQVRATITVFGKDALDILKKSRNSFAASHLLLSSYTMGFLLSNTDTFPLHYKQKCHHFVKERILHPYQADPGRDGYPAMSLFICRLSPVRGVDGGTDDRQRYLPMNADWAQATSGTSGADQAAT